MQTTKSYALAKIYDEFCYNSENGDGRVHKFVSFSGLRDYDEISDQRDIFCVLEVPDELLKALVALRNENIDWSPNTDSVIATTYTYDISRHQQITTSMVVSLNDDMNVREGFSFKDDLRNSCFKLSKEFDIKTNSHDKVEFRHGSYNCVLCSVDNVFVINSGDLDNYYSFKFHLSDLENAVQAEVLDQEEQEEQMRHTR